MSRRVAEEDDWEGDEADDDSTIPSPYCKREIHADTPRCPYCEQYISQEDPPSSHKPWWIIIGAGLCLYAAYLWITR